MQWSQIKTLFILCFLILDIYLVLQFMEKQDQKDIGVIEQENSTIEEQLEQDEIEISAELDSEEISESYISVSPKSFTEGELNEVSNFDNQVLARVNSYLIVSQFEEPLEVPEKATGSEITEMVNGKIIFSDQYEYWDWDKELNVLVFFQEKNDRPIYYNHGGIILVFLNDENEIMFYAQTMLGEAESEGESKTLIEPIQAIETLYTSNELFAGDDITDLDVGYYTRYPLENGVQVFAPQWNVLVNGEKNFFVNAIERIVSPESEDFLENAITTLISRINDMEETEKIHEDILNQLRLKLTADNRSDL
ncbi:two-component system regulatory protein YycI [Virgibacillus byunsanensis]|uniref:Two-component system regulatory protein YycI n=1 Tax=Virgibacillus byunsanensis TaxID=570945 RepID=A0ABW3LQI5_9BACI